MSNHTKTDEIISTRSARAFGITTLLMGILTILFSLAMSLIGYLPYVVGMWITFTDGFFLAIKMICAGYGLVFAILWGVILIPGRHFKSNIFNILAIAASLAYFWIFLSPLVFSWQFYNLGGLITTMLQLGAWIGLKCQKNTQIDVHVWRMVLIRIPYDLFLAIDEFVVFLLYWNISTSLLIGHISTIYHIASSFFIGIGLMKLARICINQGG